MTGNANRQIRAAGILLFHCQGENDDFLLLRHADRWDLPKGHCDQGETFLQTAMRETAEETGIAADQIEIDFRFQFELNYPVRYTDHPDKIFDKRVCYFLGYLNKKPRLRLTEHLSAKWFPWNPPHQIQKQTIDPLLRAVAKHRESMLNAGRRS